MPRYTLTSTYSGPYAVVVGDIIQNDGGGKIYVAKAASTPANDTNSLEMFDMNVVRVTAAGNIYARAHDGSAILKVVPVI